MVSTRLTWDPVGPFWKLTYIKSTSNIYYHRHLQYKSQNTNRIQTPSTHVTSSLKTHQKRSVHLRGACHRSCGVQRGGSNLQAQSGVMVGATLVKVEPGSPQNMLVWKMTLLFTGLMASRLIQKNTPSGKTNIHWSWRWELVASNWHHISRIHPLSRVYRMWIGQWNWYCRILIQTAIIIHYIHN